MKNEKHYTENMSNDLASNIEKLIDSGYGDYGRLTAILESVRKGRTLYSSDQQYVDNLISKHVSPTEHEIDYSNTQTQNNENRTSQIDSEDAFCTKCGNYVVSNMGEFCAKCGTKAVKKKLDNFCGKCGKSLSSNGICTYCTPSNRFSDHNDSQKLHSLKRRTYQKLVLVGGIFGIVITPIIAFSAGIMLAIGSAFSPSSITPEQSANLTMIATAVSIIVSIIGIIVAYLIKKPKSVGIILILLGIVEMIGTMVMYGIITWVLFIVAGIIAVRKSADV